VEFKGGLRSDVTARLILAEVTGKRGPIELILIEAGRCPICKHAVTEKTLIDRRDA